MTLTVQAILQEHFDAFAKTYPLAPYQLDAARQLRDCRTAALGGHWRSCPEGHVHTPHYNSCHHRSCPLCAALARERWLDDWKTRLLALLGSSLEQSWSHFRSATNLDPR